MPVSPDIFPAKIGRLRLGIELAFRVPLFSKIQKTFEIQRNSDSRRKRKQTDLFICRFYCLRHH